MTRVLVVHHDHDVADIEVDALRRAGFEVDQCAGPIGGDPCPVLNGLPCWQVARTDVLVYDTWAAGDGGQELIADVRDLHPDKPVVLTSMGLLLDWVEMRGPHRVEPYSGAPTGSGLVEAVKAAARSGHARKAAVARWGEPARPRRQAAVQHSPTW